MNSVAGRMARPNRAANGVGRLSIALAASAVALLSLAGSASGASFAANPASLGPIPDGTVGCPGSYGADRDVIFTVVGVASPIQNIAVSLTLSPAHTWVGDLSVALIAPGGSPSMAVFHRTGAVSSGGFGEDSNVAGPYTFSDTAPASPTWWEAAAAAGSFEAIPSGSYRPSTPGEDLGGGANALFGPVFGAATPNGTWTLRSRDKCMNETGSVSAATLFLNEGLSEPPAPEPPAPTPPAPAPPAPPSSPAAFGARTLVTLKLAAGRLAAQGPLQVLVENRNPFAVSGTLSGQTTRSVAVSRHGRTQLNAKSFSVAAKAEKTITLRLPRALRRLLTRRGKLSLQLTAKAKDPAGNTRTVKKEVTPKMKPQRRR